MSPAAAAKVLDFNKPDTATSLGGDLEQTALALAQRTRGMAIVDRAGCEQAVLDRQSIGDAIKRVEEFFAPFKKMAYDLHKALCTRENAVLLPLRNVDLERQGAIRTFNDEQNRLREAEERKQAEQARRDEEARAAAAAAALETAGDHEMAAAVMAEAIAAPTPVVVLPTLKQQVAGLKTVRRWLWRYPGATADVKTSPPAVVVRTMALVPREFLCVDAQKVSNYVKAMKGAGRIPGLEIYYVDDPVR